jgi:hypothetical protein
MVDVGEVCTVKLGPFLGSYFPSDMSDGNCAQIGHEMWDICRIESAWGLMSLPHRSWCRIWKNYSDLTLNTSTTTNNNHNYRTNVKNCRRDSNQGRQCVTWGQLREMYCVWRWALWPDKNNLWICFLMARLFWWVQMHRTPQLWQLCHPRSGLHVSSNGCDPIARLDQSKLTLL